jgi:hypothetical protein
VRDTPDQKRILTSWTEIDVKIGPVPFGFRQRLSAVAGEGPAAFQASIDANGAPRVVQGRKAGGEWRLSIAENGTARQWTLGSLEVDLSTVDLVDPGSALPLWRLEDARVLSAETGGILAGKVYWEARGEVRVGGMGVPVDRYRFESSEGVATFAYAGDGSLVRYDMRLFGRTVTGTLRDLPASVDDVPVDDGGGSVGVAPL